MTGEALNRRYHELCGWTFHPADYTQCGEAYCLDVWEDSAGNELSKLPPLHLDANLAIAEADKVLGEYELKRMHMFMGTFELFFSIHGIPKAESANGVMNGNPLTTVILKALIAAKEGKS